MRALVTVLAVLWAASSAGAVSLSMTTDQSVYATLETVVVTVTGDTTGAADAFSALVQVGWDDPTRVDGLAAVATQSAAITSFFTAVPWTVTNPACLADGCAVLSQELGGGIPAPVDAAIIVGTLMLPTLQPGVLTLTAELLGGGWFGAAAPPPVVVTIVGIPEPGTAALLLAGLVGLGLGRGR